MAGWRVAARGGTALVALAATLSAGLVGATAATPDVGASIAPSPLVLVANQGNGQANSSSVTAISTGTEQVVATVLVGKPVQDVAIAPDGTTAYVSVSAAGSTPDEIVPLDLTSGLPVPEHPVLTAAAGCASPGSLVVTADDSTLLAGCASGVMEFTLNNNDVPVPGPLIQDGPALDAPSCLVVNPQGGAAYVIFSSASPPTSEIVPLNLNNTPPTAESPVPVGTRASCMTVTPDGVFGLVSDTTGNSIIPVNLFVFPIRVGTPITGTNLNGPTGLALDPGRSTVYAVDTASKNVAPVDLKSTTVHTPVSVASAPGSPSVDALDPVGNRVYVISQGNAGTSVSGAASLIDTSSHTVVATIGLGLMPNSVAVQPDQPPSASFSIVNQGPGQTTTFDASASTVQFGRITSYAWSFGDGTSATTTTPVVSHVYATPGSYPASVVETDSAGTSTTAVDTGAAMLQNGGSSAFATHLVQINSGCSSPCGVVGMAPTPDGAGYWEVGANGAVYPFGTAVFYGSMGGQTLTKPVVAMAPTPNGKGYWEVAADGGIFAFGTAAFYGSMGGQPLNAPVVGIAPSPDGTGYWEVAADGGIFAFGTAAFYGSMGGQPLNGPVVGIGALPGGGGYWEVAADGGIFAFGAASFFGSMGGRPLDQAIVGLGAVPGGGGYWEVAGDGGLFAFGQAGYYGSLPGLTG